MNDVEKISSRENQRIVNARKVRDGKDTSLIFVEGRRLVDEAVRSAVVIDECFYVDGFRDTELLSAISVRTPKMAEIPERIFRSIVDTDNSQGIILIAERPNYGAVAIEESLKSKSSALRIVLFVMETNNPSNLGALLRTAEAAGVAGVVISENSADVYSPKSLRAAMGASFRLPIWDRAGFEEILDWAKNWDLVSTAADVGATKSYTQIDWSRPRLLIFGSEAHGLNESELKSIDEHLKIPMDSVVESLNLAVSAGVILFEARRQTVSE